MIGAALCRGHGAAESKPFDKIVDERQVIEHPAAADHRKSPPREAAEHSQKPRVAGSVNSNRPRHDHIETGALAKLTRRLLRLELGFLVNVAGIERRIFIRGRIGNVPMHAAGAAVHQSSRAAGFRRVQHVARAIDVDGAVGRIALACFPIGRGNVIHDVDAVCGAMHRGRIEEVALNGDHALARQLRGVEPGAALRAHQRPHFIATRRQR